MGGNDFEDNRLPSEPVVYEVAEQEGVQPEDLNPPLFESSIQTH